MNNVNKKELIHIIKSNIHSISPELIQKAQANREKYYGKKVYFRGLLEISNNCFNNCYYCGIRKNNKDINRYRLTKEEILQSCDYGYKLGFKTFVLQGGEDPYYTDNKMVSIISDIKSMYPDCAVTLSLGERSTQTYKEYFNAGADRYLLRHETATKSHYNKLHPSNMQLENRKKCLYALKDIGYQVGAGFMVGSPYQKIEHMAEDLLFLKELDPHMVGLGPFVPNKDTRFAKKKAGNVEATVVMLALTRILLPKVLLPATTALGTIDPRGREWGLNAGANVIMPNISPMALREDYALYDNKLYSDSESAGRFSAISKELKELGYIPDYSRGDYYDE